MKSNGKKVIIISIICLVILIGSLILDYFLNKSYFEEIKFSEVVEKINNKDTFVLCISQTTCSHCLSYKPKLEAVANEEKITIYYMEYDLLSDEEKEDFKNYINFSGTPTTVFLINGEEKTVANRISGDTTKEKIIKKLKSNGFID